jgi:hypothetical protein
LSEVEPEVIPVSKRAQSKKEEEKVKEKEEY